MKKSPVVHFEMPAKDKDRVAKFYSEALGWDMQKTGEEFGGYLMAITTPVDEKTQRPTESGAINGGFFDYKDEPGFNAPHLVLSVEDIEEARKSVEDAGGKILSEKMDIPGVGLYYSFKDTEGNVVGLLQPAPMG